VRGLGWLALLARPPTAAGELRRWVRQGGMGRAAVIVLYLAVALQVYMDPCCFLK